MVIRAVGAGCVFAGTLIGFNAQYGEMLPGARRHAEKLHAADGEEVWAVIGSSNVLTALDARMLDSLDAAHHRVWFNVAAPGLAGEALLSEALAFVEARESGTLSGLCVELIGSPLHAPPVDRRTARWVPWRAAVEAHYEAARDPRDTAGVGHHGRRLVEHAILRSTTGLHAWLHPERSEEEGDGKGGTAAEGAWNGEPDSLRKVRLGSEEATYRAFAGTPLPPAASVFPLAQLHRLHRACRQKNVALVVCVQPASGHAGLVGPVGALLGAPPVLLDGGQRPTPFVTLALLADPVHVNREGARRVTQAFYEELRRREILK